MVVKVVVVVLQGEQYAGVVVKDPVLALLFLDNIIVTFLAVTIILKIGVVPSMGLVSNWANGVVETVSSSSSGTTSSTIVPPIDPSTIEFIWVKGEHLLERTKGTSDASTAHVALYSDHKSDFLSSFHSYANNKWVIDYGASSHASGNNSLFSKLPPTTSISRYIG